MRFQSGFLLLSLPVATGLIGRLPLAAAAPAPDTALPSGSPAPEGQISDRHSAKALILNPPQPAAMELFEIPRSQPATAEFSQTLQAQTLQLQVSLTPETKLAQAALPAAPNALPLDASVAQIPNPIEPKPPTQTTPPPLPPPDQLFQLPTAPQPPTPQPPSELPSTINVRQFNVVGSTLFSQEKLATITTPFTNKEITFAELSQVASAITKLYTDAGYVNSGAIIPADQTFQPQGGTVRIQVLEGSLEAIRVTGTRRLNPSYVRRRLEIAASKPLNVKQLVEALQKLQLDPLLETVSAELAASAEPGKSILNVRVKEAPTFSAQLQFDNNRSPAVGTFQRRIQLREGNFLGIGDALTLGYSNTDGSFSVDTSYTIPFNPRNGTFSISYSGSGARVIEKPFDSLRIASNSASLDLTLRQPIIQTPRSEFALGLTAGRRSSRATLFDGTFPFPAAGSDRDGITRLTTLRFFQEWTQRSERSVFAMRSQFSLGLNALDATVNLIPPDGRFFTWRGQAQWVRLLAPDTLLLLRGDLQLADRPLVGVEQFGVGGQDSVRGYRQDQLLTDNGAFVSAEFRLPIWRFPKANGVLQLTPFAEVGTGWNQDSITNPKPNTVASVGLGLRLQLSDRLTARLNWGIPLTSVSTGKKSWQENGIYFSVVWNAF